MSRIICIHCFQFDVNIGYWKNHKSNKKQLNQELCENVNGIYFVFIDDHQSISSQCMSWKRNVEVNVSLMTSNQLDGWDNNENSSKTSET